MVQELNALDIIDEAAFPKTTVSLCMRQDLEEERGKLRMQIATARAAATVNKDRESRLGEPKVEDSEEILEMEARLREVEEQMVKATLHFDFEGVSTQEYNQMLYKSGKPRPNNEIDKMTGTNQANFVAIAIRRCCVRVRTTREGDEGIKFTDQQWEKVFNAITDAQYDELAVAMHTVNKKVVPTPSMGRR